MEISEYISGKYEQQYEYKSFLPERINHAWHVDEPELVTLLEDANWLLGELNAFSQLVPDVDFFIKMHISPRRRQLPAVLKGLGLIWKRPWLRCRILTQKEEMMYQRPIVHVKGVKGLLNVQTNTASSLVSEFEKFGILQEMTGYKRNRTFVFSEYVQLFK